MCPERAQFPDQNRACIVECIERTEPDSHALYQEALIVPTNQLR